MQRLLSNLKYIGSRRSVLKNLVSIKEKEILDFVIQTAEDAIMLCTDIQQFNKHTFGKLVVRKMVWLTKLLGKRLADSLNKPVLNYAARGESTHSINWCDEKYVASTPTPGQANNCDGIDIDILYNPSEQIDVANQNNVVGTDASKRPFTQEVSDHHGKNMIKMCVLIPC